MRDGQRRLVQSVRVQWAAGQRLEVGPSREAGREDDAGSAVGNGGVGAGAMNGHDEDRRGAGSKRRRRAASDRSAHWSPDAM